LHMLVTAIQKRSGECPAMLRRPRRAGRAGGRNVRERSVCPDPLVIALGG